MEKLVVKGGTRLVGTVKTSGAKNAVLPIIAASILGTTPSHLDEVPQLEDVHTISEVLKCLGLAVSCPEPNVLDIDSTKITSYEAPYELVRTMRASFLVMGPLLARVGKARISMPGGCAIGARPIDIHLKAFEALGVKIEQGHGYIDASAPNGLKGTNIYFDFPSVGATENVLMAASLAEGVTIVENAAEEPEIVDLANYLNKMGAKIRGAGTDTIRIEGVKELHGADYTIIPDRIEAGTYMIAAAMTGGDVIIENVLPEHQKPLIAKLREAGAFVEEDIDKVRVVGKLPLKPVAIKTLPYPGFPTDMQPQMTTVLTLAQGTSLVTEGVWSSRYRYVDELKRMGARIQVDDKTAVVEGVEKLTGAPIQAYDLRAGAALVIAALAAEGESEISNVQYIERGYEDIIGKLRALGADIRAVEEPDEDALSTAQIS